MSVDEYSEVSSLIPQGTLPWQPILCAKFLLIAWRLPDLAYACHLPDLAIGEIPRRRTINSDFINSLPSHSCGGTTSIYRSSTAARCWVQANRSTWFSDSPTDCYPPPFQIFQRSDRLLSLCNFLIRRYQSSILSSSIVFLDDFSCFLSFAATTPKFIITGDFNIYLIILQTLSPLRFCPTPHLHGLFLSPIGVHTTTFLSSPLNTLLFPASTLHRRWFFSDWPEILSAHNRSSEITWTSSVCLQHHCIFSTWQTCSRRHQTLQVPVSIKPMVFYHPPCILIHPPPCWKHLETYSLCCWLVLLQVPLQPIPQGHPVFQKKYYSNLVSDNPKRLWQTVNKLLHRQYSSLLSTTSPGTSLADSFASFFTGKISKLRLSLTSNPTTSSPHSPSPPATPPDFSVFSPASESEVYKILSNCPNKQSDSNPILTWLLECWSILVPTITSIVNPLPHFRPVSWFHPTLKESIISPLLKKPTLDKEELSNYRPISNLSLTSKITFYSILTSQPTANIILPKQLFCTSTIT